MDAEEWAEISTLRTLFEEKGWGNQLNEKRENIFDKTVELYLSLDRDQRELFIMLLEDFDRVTDYSDFAWSIASDAETHFGINAELAFVPVEGTERNIKSGHALCYEIKRYLDPRKFRNAIVLDGIEAAMKLNNTYQIIIVDDFIGSGSQILKFIKKIKSNGMSIENRLSIYCMFMQARAYKRLHPICNRIVTHKIKCRALSDKVTIGRFTSKEAINIYASIEALLSMPVYYKFGYSRSEALISVKRTPNNTLPIFWVSSQKGQRKWPAPFFRPL